MNVTVSRTHDMELVKSIIGHPSIWPNVHDDGVSEPTPQDNDVFYWLLVEYENVPSGIFLFHPHSEIWYESHICLLPHIRGAVGKIASLLAIEWMFENTSCQKLTGNTPANNVAAIRHVRSCGFQREGINKKSFLKNGVLIDQHMLGLTKEDWLSYKGDLNGSR